MALTPDPIRVLHVDDDPDLAALVKTYLEREDDRIEVVTATGAADGCEVLAAEPVHCVVSDYDMPGTDGIEFLDAVRETHPDLPFVLFTGKGSEEIASKAISAGVTDYLQKGAGTDQYALLANRIRNAVEAERSRRALEERNRRLETLVSNLPGVVYRCENAPNWPMEYVEGECEELVGYSAAAIETGGVSWGEDVVHPDDRERIWETVQSALDDREPFEVTYRVVTADGETRWTWERGRGVFEGDDEPAAIEGFITDVTERKRRHKELHRYETLVDAMPDAACIYDADGRFEVVNEYLADWYDATPAEVQGRESELVQRIREEGDGDPFRELVDGERAELYGEFEGEFGGHGRAVVDYRFTRLTIDGEFDGVVAVARDVTARKERERELERQNERLDEFVSVVSHDLRNPLTVASGRLELVRRECDSDHVDAVERAHDQMGALIDDLLTLARDTETSPETEPVDLAALVEDCWATVEAGDATVPDETDLTVETGLTVEADRSRLRQLVENLLDNAVTHGAEEGRPVTVQVQGLADGFAVADDGSGVPPDERDDVFDAGFSTADDGTGFGLRIVKQVVDEHGWSIDLTESRRGGARFEIRGVDTA